jgi:hypothetical protein
MVEIIKVPLLFRLLDRMLWPVMFVLGGCKFDSIQETHRWHGQPIDAGEIDERLSVFVEGNDRSPVRTNALYPFPTFHAPILGGWRNYTVLQIQAVAPYWHVGWIHRRYPFNGRPRSHAQRLPIFTGEIRVLTQAIGFQTQYFALDSSGRQIPLKVVGEGVLGDGKFPHVRLF